MEDIFLLNKKVSLLQPDTGFRTSQDAVLLAAACPAKGSETVLDMGCGVGGALFCLLWREQDLNMTGIDIEPTYLDLAAQNAEKNHHNVTFIEQDVTQYRVNEPSKRYNHIICNPPFFSAGDHTPSPEKIRAGARGYTQEGQSFESWIKSALDNLKSKGSFCLIHQADKLDEILFHLRKRFGATDIIPIYSKPNEPAKRVILRSYKDRYSPCRLLSPVYMHRKDGCATEMSNLLLREGMSFDKVFAGTGKKA